MSLKDVFKVPNDFHPFAINLRTGATRKATPAEAKAYAKSTRTITAADMLKREQAKAKREKLELAFAQQVRAVGLDHLMTREHEFHPKRKWRFDFAFQVERVAIEVDGGVHTGGRHTRGDGFEADCEKMSTAAVYGWRVLRVTAKTIKSGQAINWVQLMIGQG